MRATFELRPIGRVESPLEDTAVAPKQGTEGAPDAWLVLDPAFADAASDLRAGDDVFVLTTSFVILVMRRARRISSSSRGLSSTSMRNRSHIEGALPDG